MTYAVKIHKSHPSAPATDDREGTVERATVREIAEALAEIGYAGPTVTVYDDEGCVAGWVRVSATGRAEWAGL